MTISIQLNGEKHTFEKPMDIASILNMLNIPVSSVIVEYNRNVLQKANFSNIRVNNGDVIELIRIVGGG